MKHITFYLDFISPYAYLAFEKLPAALQGLTYSVDYKPVLFAAFLKHHGQLGPAEIPPKRDWTNRQVLWNAHANGIAMQFPSAHPFNPLPLLRLALACGDKGRVNRYVVETIFRHVWREGGDPVEATRLESLQETLQPKRDPASDEVKHELRANTDDAVARGLFGVPSLVIDDKLFWGFDALPMVRAYLEGDAWFASGAWEAVAGVRAAVSRVSKLAT